MWPQSGFPGCSDSKESALNAGVLGGEDPLEKGMAAHFSFLACRIPWTEELGARYNGPWGRKELDTTEHSHTCYYISMAIQKELRISEHSSKFFHPVFPVNSIDLTVLGQLSKHQLAKIQFTKKQWAE